MLNKKTLLEQAANQKLWTKKLRIMLDEMDRQADYYEAKARISPKLQQMINNGEISEAEVIDEQMRS